MAAAARVLESIAVNHKDDGDDVNDTESELKNIGDDMNSEERKAKKRARKKVVDDIERDCLDCARKCLKLDEKTPKISVLYVLLKIVGGEVNLDKVMKSADDVTHYHGLAQKASAVRGSYLQLGSPPSSAMQLPAYSMTHGGGVAVGTPGIPHSHGGGQSLSLTPHMRQMEDNLSARNKEVAELQERYDSLKKEFDIVRSKLIDSQDRVIAEAERSHSLRDKVECLLAELTRLKQTRLQDNQ